MQRGVDGHIEMMTGSQVQGETRSEKRQQVRRSVAAMMAIDAGGAIVLMTRGIDCQGCMVRRQIGQIYIRCPAETGEQCEHDQQTGYEMASHGFSYCTKRGNAASCLNGYSPLDSD